MVYRPTHEPPITLDTTRRNAKKWLSIIRYGEYGTVIQLQDDCEYRVNEILEDPSILRKYLGPYFRKYILKYIPIDSDNLTEKIHSELLNTCRDRKIILSRNAKTNFDQLLKEIGENGFEVGLFISHITQLLEELNYIQLFQLEQILEKAKNTSLILFCEKNITGPAYQRLTDKCSLLFDNIEYYPLYADYDSRQFIRYHEDLWDIKVSKEIRTGLIQTCGGYLWLISHLVRYFRDNPKATLEEATKDPLLRHKLEAIWSKFTSSEKNVITAVDKGNTLENSAESEYLNQIGIIERSAKKMSLKIPLLSQMIEYESKLNKFHIRDSQIFLNEKEITSEFTPNERRFIFPLLQSKTSMVTRETISRSVWGEKWQEKYSDWALDRIAYRVRTKLKKIGIDPTLLKTAKRKGFLFG